MFEIKLTIYIRIDLALNNEQSLICHKTQTTKQPLIMNIQHLNMYCRDQDQVDEDVGPVIFLVPQGIAEDGSMVST